MLYGEIALVSAEARAEELLAKLSDKELKDKFCDMLYHIKLQYRLTKNAKGEIGKGYSAFEQEQDIELEALRLAMASRMFNMPLDVLMEEKFGASVNAHVPLKVNDIIIGELWFRFIVYKQGKIKLGFIFVETEAINNDDSLKGLKGDALERAKQDLAYLREYNFRLIENVLPDTTGNAIAEESPLD